MPAITYDVTNRSSRIGREVSVMALIPAPVSGTSGTSVSFIGVYESFDIKLVREYTDTTGSADQAKTSRAVRWGEGSVTLTGFVRGASSAMAALFANYSHVILQFTEFAAGGVVGDSYQLMCTCKDYGKALGKDANKDTLTLGQEGTPFWQPSGGTLGAMVLEA